MSETPPPETETPSPRHLEDRQLAQFLRSFRCSFGPDFFVGQLASFLRQRCPEPSEHLPRVEVWFGGEPLHICHIVAIAPSWVALAVRDREDHAEMRTELIPYEMITRVTVGAPATHARGIGFDASRAPVILESPPSPAAVLAMAAQSNAA